ncbi:MULTISPECIES: acyl carrier protein [unclassified Bradyrhizobium]|uniref:acyl carrier protein n=1 Tax=Bradyrhizobium TaxID=374 RepID=UPI0028EAE9C3|nr:MULTISPECIES: acyl carrier protein [unclassified Bradyrhizobium]
MPGETTVDKILAASRELFPFELKLAQIDTPLPSIPGLNFDSLKAMEMVSLLEELFGIEIDFGVDDLSFNLSTVRRAAQLVERKLSVKHVSGAAE